MDVPDISVNSENRVSPSKPVIDVLSVYDAKMLMPGAVMSGCIQEFIGQNNSIMVNIQEQKARKKCTNYKMNEIQQLQYLENMLRSWIRTPR